MKFVVVIDWINADSKRRVYRRNVTLHFWFPSSFLFFLIFFIFPKDFILLPFRRILLGFYVYRKKVSSCEQQRVDQWGLSLGNQWHVKRRSCWLSNGFLLLLLLLLRPPPHTLRKREGKQNKTPTQTVFEKIKVWNGCRETTLIPTLLCFSVEFSQSAS